MQNIRVGGKRKAEYCKSPARVPATPVKPKSKSKAKKASETLSVLSSSLQGTFPPYVHTYPPTSTFDLNQSFVPSCSNNTLYPIITTTPFPAVHDPLSSTPHYHSCSDSLPADFHVQEYYLIEDDPAFPSTPNYPTYDDDHICYALRMSDDPFLQEMSSDYYWSGKASQSTGFKTEYSGTYLLSSSFPHSVNLIYDTPLRKSLSLSLFLCLSIPLHLSLSPSYTPCTIHTQCLLVTMTMTCSYYI